MTTIVYRCLICDLYFSTEENARQHYRENHEEKKIVYIDREVEA